MKNLILILAVSALFTPVPQAIAGGNLQVAIDQQWSRVEAWQKQQAKRFKAIEKDADRSLNSLGRGSKHGTISGEPPCPSSKRQLANRK